MKRVPGFPALRGTKMLALLQREFGYRRLPRRGKGSHDIYVAAGWPQITWSFGKRDLSSVEVRKVLVEKIGLTIEEAKEVVKRA